MTELNYLDITKASDGHIRVPSIGLTSPAITENIAKTALASFSDGAEGIPVKSLIADITPVQTGSGDPSPSNVRPITGWTGMNVVRTGKNLFDVVGFVSGQTNTSGVPLSPAAYTISNGVVSISQNLVTNGRRMFGSIKLSPATYTVSFVPTLSGTNYKVAWSVRLMDDPKSDVLPVGVYAVVNGQRTSFSFTVTVEGNYAISLQPQNADSGTLQLTDIQLERSASATTYEPYNGTTYPISWADEAGTVYGGTLDVTTGLLTVTHGSDVYNGTTSPVVSVGTSSSTGNHYAIVNLTSTTRATNGSNIGGAISNMLTEGVTPTAQGKFSIIGSGTNAKQASLVLPDQTITTKAAFDTYLQTNPITLCYPLTTPQTYQLTPQAVLTILGQNNIWADTGDVEVAYCADTKMYIDKMIAEL